MKATRCVCIWLALSGVAAMAQVNPVPFVQQPVLPTSVLPGGPTFTLIVNGSGFVAGATVNWNSSPRPTIVLTATQLTATISASDIATPSTAMITVTNPPPGGGASNYLYLSVTNPIAMIALARTDLSIGAIQENMGIGSSFPFGGNLVTGDFNGDGK